jgi:Domain of unknown function (DUF4384)
MQMKSRLFVLMTVAVLGCAVFIVSAQQPDDDVRGAFISTRPKTTNTSAPARRRRPPRPSNTNSNSTVKNANTGTTQVKNSNANFAGNSNGSGVVAVTTPIGLGYTLFMRESTGHSVRVAPDHEFHNGDRVRISLEPSVDGYLYVFHTEGNGSPEMIYPDPRLDGGENWIAAHVPMEVPSAEETDERLRWFTFYGDPGTERLYVVVTREPLPLVPTGEDLISFCQNNKDRCPWHPLDEVWKQVQDGTRASVKVVTSKSFGQTETDKEKDATTRGLGLDQTAPEPAVIRMNASTNAPILVTVLDLIHK